MREESAQAEGKEEVGEMGRGIVLPISVIERSHLVSNHLITSYSERQGIKIIAPRDA